MPLTPSGPPPSIFSLVKIANLPELLMSSLKHFRWITITHSWDVSSFRKFNIESIGWLRLMKIVQQSLIWPFYDKRQPLKRKKVEGDWTRHLNPWTTSPSFYVHRQEIQCADFMLMHPVTLFLLQDLSRQKSQIFVLLVYLHLAEVFCYTWIEIQAILHIIIIARGPIIAANSANLALFLI